MFNYDPNEAVKLIPEGEYSAEITAASAETSKNTGKKMLKLTFKVYTATHEGVLFDYIVRPETIWKLKKLCQAVGMGDQFEKGQLDPAALVGKGCKIVVKIKTEKKGTYAGQESNQIVGYKEIGATTTATAEAVEDDLALDEDKIPF